jgi:hypothetical protein
MSGSKDKLGSVLFIVSFLFSNPLLRRLFGLIEFIIFIVLACLLVMGKISFGLSLILLAVLFLLPILCGLFLLGLCRLLASSAKGEEESKIDSSPEHD